MIVRVVSAIRSSGMHVSRNSASSVVISNGGNSRVEAGSRGGGCDDDRGCSPAHPCRQRLSWVQSPKLLSSLDIRYGSPDEGGRQLRDAAAAATEPGTGYLRIEHRMERSHSKVHDGTASTRSWLRSDTTSRSCCRGWRRSCALSS
jgi:hypothetical protein